MYELMMRNFPECTTFKGKNTIFIDPPVSWKLQHFSSLSLKDAVADGGKLEFGGKVIEGNFVEPTIVSGLRHDSPVVHRWKPT